MSDNEAMSPIGRMLPGGGRWTKRTHTWIPEVDREHKFRIDRLKSELDLEERAASDGRANLPDQQDGTLNEPQLEICNRVFSGILMLNQFLAEQLGKALDQARREAPEKLKLSEFQAQMRHRVDDEFADHEPGLKDLSAIRRDRIADLRYFRTVNRLNRTADYKDSILLVIGIILAMLVLESVLNSFIFAEVSSQGLVGGWVLAFVISGINVALGVGVGLYGWRNIGHVRLLNRAVGLGLTLIGHAFAIFWNLLVGHFREVATAAAKSDDFDFDIGELANQSWAHMQSVGWFGLQSIIAWALVALGLGIHFLSAKEGWDDVADRYPDYKRKDYRAREAVLDFDEAILEMRKSCREAADEIVEEAQGVASVSRARLSAILNLQDVATQREREVRDSEDEWVNGGTQLLKAYRDINLQVREEGTAPAYFLIYPTAADYRKRSFGIGRDGSTEIDSYVTATEKRMADIRELRAQAEAVIEENDKLLEQMRSEVNRLLDGLDMRIANKRDEIGRATEAEAAENIVPHGDRP